MRLKRKKRSIDIESPTVDIDNLVKDTTRQERFQIFDLLAFARKYLVVMLMISGALATFFSVQFLMKVQILSPPMNFIALAVMGFIAIANIVCGLLLLASE